MRANVSVSDPPVPAARPQQQGLSLRRNVSWTTAGNLLYALCQWGVLTIIAKSGTPAMVGMFALGLAITAPVFQFANLQLRGIQATDARGEHPFHDYFTLRVGTTVLALLVSAVFAVTGDRPRETIFVVVLIALAKAVDAFSDVFYGHFQQRERMDVIAIGQIAKGVLSVVFVGLGLVLANSIVVAMVGYVAGATLPLVVYTVPVALRSLRAVPGSGALLRWDPVGLAALARTALPLGVVMLLISLNTNIPRYVIEHEFGERELGIFAALAYLIVAGSMVITAIGQAVSPRLSRQYAAGDTVAFRVLLGRLIGGALALGALGAVSAWLVGEPVVSLLYTSEYANDLPALVVLAVAGGITFAASFAGFGMTAARRFRAQVPVFLAVVATCIIVSVVLIPANGVRGAAVALLASALVQLGCSLWVVRGALRIRGASA